MITTSDIPFEPVYSESVFQTAKDWLVNTKSRFVNTSNFAIISSDGTVTPFLNMICHRLIKDNSVDNRCLVATEIGLDRRKEPMLAEIAYPFLRWFLYESYLSRFILNRDDFDFVKKFGFIVSADMPACMLQNIMIISRHFYEVHSRSFLKFNELTEKGIDPRLAFISCFSSGFGTTESYNDGSAVISYNGHRSSPLFDLRSFRNFMNDKVGTGCPAPLFSKTSHYRNSRDYTGGLKIFFDRDNCPAYFDTTFKHFVYDLMEQNTEFRDVLSAHRKKVNSGDLYRPPNPFQKTTLLTTPPESHQVSYTEFFDFVIPFVQEKGILYGSDS